jgi:hypothetical protein
MPDISRTLIAQAWPSGLAAARVPTGWQLLHGQRSRSNTRHFGSVPAACKHRDKNKLKDGSWQVEKNLVVEREQTLPGA